MFRAACAILPVLGLCLGCSDSGADGGCQPGDQDGVIGGNYTFKVTVDDDAFTPTILKAQNTATVTVVLTNAGTKPHGFRVHCIDTPNDTGCPAESCFPEAATIDPVAPGESARTKFALPRPEGIYPISSSARGDSQEAQFVVQ